MKIINEYFINDLNYLIEECVHDGADCGGSYHINTSGMIDAIETVLMQYHHGRTICVSSQIGCKLGCKFCASTGIPFSRNSIK